MKKTVQGKINQAIKKQLEDRKAAEKYAEERMEKIVVFCREKILPILSKNDFTIEKTKHPLEILGVTIQQAFNNKMAQMKVSETGIFEIFKESKEKNPSQILDDMGSILEILRDETVQDAIESLQWFIQKIDTVIKEEGKKRQFSSLNITLE